MIFLSYNKPDHNVLSLLSPPTSAHVPQIQKRTGLLETTVKEAKQDTVRQVESPQIEAGQGNSIEGRVSRSDKRLRDTLAPTVRSPTKTLTYIRNLLQMHAGPVLATYISVSPA